MLKTIVTINKIIFKKDDFYILSAHDMESGTNITIKGNIDEKPNKFKNYSLIAKENDDKKYGKQYDIVLMSEDLDFNDIGNKKNGFLSVILTQTQAENFLKEFENPIEVIESKDIRRITKVKGIGESLANKIVKKYEEKKQYMECVETLSGYDISFSVIKRIVDCYKNTNKSIKTILENPYNLIIDVRGVGWEIADSIASSIGIDEFSQKRVEGYIFHTLTKNAEEGDSWMNVSSLFKEVSSLFISSKPTVELKKKMTKLYVDSVKSLKDDGVLWTSDDKKRISLMRLRKLEENICKEILRLLRSSDDVIDTKKECRIDSIIEKIELEQGFKLSDKQNEAVKSAHKHNVMVLNGSAGTGKSSTAKAIINSFEENFNLLALSGMASTRIGELAELEGTTIHRFLGAGKGVNGGFLLNSSNRIKANVILDESGMVSGDIFYSLLSALEDGSKIYILGDTNQISAIGNCNVLKDLIESKSIPIITLDKIFRQAQKSAIIMDATNISKGEKIFSNTFVGTELRGELKDVLYDVYNDSEETATKMFKYYKMFFNKTKDVKDVQALMCIREKGKSSCLNVNKMVQEWLIENFVVEDNGINVLDKYHINVGDKVLNTKNNYEAESVDGCLAQIFNGQQGVVKRIDREKKSIVVEFFQDKKEVVFEGKEIYNLELAYCITNSKYQGNQCKYIVTGFDYGAYKLLNKEMLYTSMTRARERCVVVCQNKAFNFATSTSGTKNRKTFLSELLKEEGYINE